MEDEQLNIFDSKGRLTGTASRADAHKRLAGRKHSLLVH